MQCRRYKYVIMCWLGNIIYTFRKKKLSLHLQIKHPSWITWSWSHEPSKSRWLFTSRYGAILQETWIFSNRVLENLKIQCSW